MPKFIPGFTTGFTLLKNNNDNIVDAFDRKRTDGNTRYRKKTAGKHKSHSSSRVSSSLSSTLSPRLNNAAIRREMNRRLDLVKGKRIGRKGPVESATRFPEGHKKRGLDGRMWIKKGLRWVPYGNKKAGTTERKKTTKTNKTNKRSKKSMSLSSSSTSSSSSSSSSSVSSSSYSSSSPFSSSSSSFSSSSF